MARISKKCFVSYSHDGCDRDTLDFILHVLREHLGEGGQLLFDQNLRIGEDFAAFMGLLDEVDAVLIVLTPSYKKKIVDRQGGVYEEFRRIWMRYSNEKSKEQENRSHFDILPILFSGSRADSTPDELAQIKQLDLTGLRVTRKATGEFLVPHQAQQILVPHIRSLALQVHALATVNSDSFSKLSNSYYDRLFVDLKASFDDSTFAGHDYLETILVKTNTYLRIESQLAYVVIGRKGSGKSTLTQVLPLIHPERYVGIINIVADEFNLESLYSLYSSDSQFRSDADAAVSRDLAFELTWEALLILAMMEVTLELYSQGALSAEDWQISPIAGLFKRIKGESNGSPAEWQVGDFFNYAFSGMIDFVRDCIDEARSEATVFLVDIGVRFDRERYLAFLLGVDALAAFRAVMRSLPKRFLVTLDGFDTAFDKFRLQGLRLQDEVRLKKRAHFEIDWLRSLLSLAMSARSKRQDYFYRNLDFCIAAPKDRFMEVMRVDRDSYRHWQRWCTLHWSGVELAILLRKRLEVLASMVTRKEASPRERLEEVLRHRSFRHLPMELDFEYNQRRYRMPLFIYVLRHTFWRPREVLVYYAALLALAEDMRRWGYEVTTDVVRKCIKASTRRIIESEFFNEFHSTVVNIREIAMAFKRSSVILGFDEIKSILFPLDFKFASGGIEELDLVAKVRFLYDVGFLGIKADKALRERFGLDSEDAFYFNEGSTILIGTDEVDLEGWKFIVHPIFCEYLWLDTQDQELTLQFTWDYLHQREAFFSANPGA